MSSSSLRRSGSAFACPQHDRNALPEACARCRVRGLAICAALADHELAELEAVSTHRRVGPGRTLVFEGDLADYAYNIVSGAVKLWKSLPDGRTQITGFLLPGDFLGLPWRGRRNITAETIQPTELCAFPRGRLEELVRKYPALDDRFLTVSGDEITAAQDHMLLLGCKTATERVASFLVAFAARVERSGGTADPLVIPLGRGDLAGYLGLTLETVSRIFSRLRARGLIALPRPDHVRLLDRAGLAALTGG